MDGWTPSSYNWRWRVTFVHADRARAILRWSVLSHATRYFTEAGSWQALLYLFFGIALAGVSRLCLTGVSCGARSKLKLSSSCAALRLHSPVSLRWVCTLP
jgi:hypothetical protein